MQRLGCRSLVYRRRLLFVACFKCLQLGRNVMTGDRPRRDLTCALGLSPYDAANTGDADVVTLSVLIDKSFNVRQDFSDHRL